MPQKQNDVEQSFSLSRISVDKDGPVDALAVEFRPSDPTDLEVNPQRVWVRTDSGDFHYTVDGVTIIRPGSNAVNPLLFGVRESSDDNTAAFNAAIKYAIDNGRKLEIPPGVFKVAGSLDVNGAVWMEGHPGTIISHVPDNDGIDLMVVTGVDAGKSIIGNMTLQGMRDGQENGRDLIRVPRGDYPLFYDLLLLTPKRDGVCLRPTSGFQWVENARFDNVKVQGGSVFIDGVLTPVTRDGFVIEVTGTVERTFVNQVTFINCETRSTYRHTARLENTSELNNTAQKISNIRFINTEFGAAPGDAAIIRLKGGPGVAPIENIYITDSAIENTEGERTGAAVQITGRMSGEFTLKNTISFGSVSKVTGYKNFPMWNIPDVSSQAYTPMLSSHEGVYLKERTGNLIAAAHADVMALIDGEVLDGYILDRTNFDHNRKWSGKMHTMGWGVYLDHGLNVNASAVEAQALSITEHCTTSGNITVTLDGTPFTVPLTAVNAAGDGSTPDQVADAIEAFTYTGFRTFRHGAQSVYFTKPDGLALTLTVDWGTTGANGTVALAQALRVTNTHISDGAELEVMVQRRIKETGF